MRRIWVLFSAVALAILVSAAGLTGADPKAPTDMTQLARLFPRHKGPTVLWVNFDGWRNYYGKKDSILPFQTTTGNRDRDIQLILFRTAEMYAPFDVQVRQAFGDAGYDRRPLGNTTVFVGGNTAKVLKGKKFPSAHTPARYNDIPGTLKGSTHRPNSNPYDLAFVDPIGQRGKDWVNVLDNLGISGAIAHEAGHTFGLMHTLTRPTQDVMSYDAPNRVFANRTFRLTDLNNTPAGLVRTKDVLPSWRGTRIVTQNSFTYLRAVLGARPADDYANVANPSAVDPAYRDGPLTEVAPGRMARGSVDRIGDYDVFRVRQAEGQRLTVWVRPQAGSRLAPLLFVFDSLGQNLVGFDNSRGRASRTAQVALPPGARVFKVVVGASDGASEGPYELVVSVRK
jgi:hypothetical protein